uniref:Apple domain-containing protein n=1 Tax=Haemonchus contortus TaxID=6289 RepID=A0A7I4YPM0_HAECO
MLSLKAVAAPSVWIFFLMQAHRALLCTFTIISTKDIPWHKVESHPNITIPARSEGVCLKQCLESFPECYMVITDRTDEQTFCFLYYARSKPIRHAAQTVSGFNANENIYVLNRTEVVTTCPLADTMLPA